MNSWSRLPISDGMSQEDRFLSALKQGYFQVDERAFETLLAMSAEFASCLNFFNIHNERDGNWSPLFTSDAAITMACILSTDIARVESEFLQRCEFSLEGGARYIGEMARQIDAWFKSLNAADDESGKALSVKISELIGLRLAADLQALTPFLARLEGRAGSHSAFTDMDFRWSAGEAGTSDRADPIQAKNNLHAIFYRFSQALTYLKDMTPVYLDHSLRTENHDPAIGLFIAFVRLFRHAQDRLNRFTPRHLDFYYDRLLRAVPRHAVPGSVYLICEAVLGGPGALITKGTKFTVGKGPEQQERIYLSDSPLTVTDAKVATLSTLYLERNPLISPESELHYATGMYITRLPIAPTPEGDVAVPPSSLFGADQQGVRQSSAEQATIGFAIASPVLLLKEGLRHITVTIEFADPFAAYFAADTRAQKEPGASLLDEIGRAESAEDVTRLLHLVFSRHLLARQHWLTPEYTQAMVDKVRTLSDSTLSEELIGALLNEDRDVLWQRFFKNIFTVSLTAQSGWYDVLNYALELPAEKDHEIPFGLSCLLTLGPDIEPITAYTPGRHGGRWATDAPVIRFCANTKKDISPYSVFDGLTVKEFVVETAVEGAKDLVLYNNNGQLDLSKPFQPFGPLPTDDSYFIVGHAEAAKKTLESASLRIEWGELPKDSGGFQAYYTGYDTPFNNEIFQAEISVLCDGHWQPEQKEARQTAPLFDTETAGMRISRSKTLQVPGVQCSKPLDPTMPEDEFRYDPTTRNGFIRVALAAPDYAFGHKRYPALLARILSANARMKQALVKPIPNAPYTPVINRITLDYKAASVMTVNQDVPGTTASPRDTVFHLHPFGTELVFPDGMPGLPALWPEYPYDGNLYIGISAGQLKGALTLFFHIHEDSSHEWSSVRPEIAWFYLASDRWSRLSKSQVISDTTNGFLSSGIVTLDIPDDIDRNNHILPNDQFWIRVSANTQLQSFGRLQSVRAHAVKVSHHQDGHAPHVGDDPIPAGSQWRPVASIPGLGKITQIGNPFGGRKKESRTQVQIRMSERLRHKYRASLPGDYEQLILERFPDVCKVKCFPSMKHGAVEPSPGHILVIVVPDMKASAGGSDFCPMMNAMALNEIGTFVRGLASPFVQIEVRNPVYERIQVRCTVKLSGQGQRGFYLTMLNHALCEYLSPWHNRGLKARFGWCILREDIEAYIRSLDYVEFVTNVSMLHITQDDRGTFRLGDTAKARLDSMQVSTEQDEIDDADHVRPRYPWSLAVPLTHHYIETMDNFESIAAEVTGINELEIGSTFIIGSKEPHG